VSYSLTCNLSVINTASENELGQLKMFDLVRFILGKFLVIPTFVARCLHACKDARDPSGKRWNYLSKSLSGNFAEMTASSPSRYVSCHKSTTKKRRWHLGYLLGICIQNMTCDNLCYKSTDFPSTEYLCYIWIPNIN